MAAWLLLHEHVVEWTNKAEKQSQKKKNPHITVIYNFLQLNKLEKKCE